MKSARVVRVPIGLAVGLIICAVAPPARAADTVAAVGFAGGAWRLDAREDGDVGGFGLGAQYGFRRGRMHIVGEYDFLVAFGGTSADPSMPPSHGSGAMHRVGAALRWRPAEVVVDHGEIALWLEIGAGRVFPRVDGMATDSHDDLTLGFVMEIRPSRREKRAWSFLFGARTIFTQMTPASSTDVPRIACIETGGMGGTGCEEPGSGSRVGAGIMMFLGGAWGR